ncbi:aminotransferase class I/II-fold pyridoxal phosphate-dependent enzyme [Alkalihalobacterium alkalicellulosilyticum]|uniref:aminotransferase class I/II-fold pyridoxal phosphate-dependent enzyme n=1 Tax=Alkalihalobacterium alkalicellulosilyticum TaxID=1912214 RepID=UPI00099671CC|nr:aminotransferase class I/II-fold pyridoxal phosphate-dependent enzyme [Bacillus alkalicellulosilyticus]
MSQFNSLSVTELNELHQTLQEKYNAFKGQGLKLDMSRGKPSSQQLDLSNGMLDVLTSEDSQKAADGTDVRNYGGLDGLPETKQFFAEILEVRPEEIIIGGNSSLNMMHDTIARALFHGVPGSEKPWSALPKVKFLCPSPGYDRHFAICELFNIEMIIVDVTEEGPDMDLVEKLVKEDEAIKGIWCVPKYSNPEGITYSDEVVDRLAKMETKAIDFRIFWDDAYTIHHLTDTPDQLKNILSTCKEVGTEDRVFIFTSTSKVTFAGSGIGVMAASETNIKYTQKLLSFQTIGPDKINQLRHLKFFKNQENLAEHMRKHAELIKPKFDIVLNTLEAELAGSGIASWKKPNGGYFISFNTLEGCAKKVVSMAKEAGVTLTGAGATFPYGKDPEDRNIRIAPTFPSLEELQKAVDVFCLCVKIASIEKLIAEQ